MNDLSGAPGNGGPEGAPSSGPRPGRAELRRAAEAQAREAEVAAASRAERRRRAELEARQRNSTTSMWRAWWLYPLVAAIGVCVYLGLQSAGSTPAPTAPVVEITEAP